MIQFLSQMMKLPVEAFVYSMGMLVKTMQGLQQIAYQGIDMFSDESSQSLSDTYSVESHVTRVAIEDALKKEVETAPQTTLKEDIRMADKNLSGEDLKLVRYKILFVKRDYEHAFEEQEELVHDNTTEAAFNAWKVGQFIQDLSPSKNKYRFPDKWNQNKDLQKHKSSQNYLTGFPFEEDDKKYLRVYFEVLERYPREPFRYQEEQISILRDIRNTLGRVDP
jgi:hypothetical protein